MKSKKLLTGVFFFACFLSAVYCAETFYSSQPHGGAVLAMAPIPDGSGYYSSGADGFVIKWDDSGNGDHYQVSDIPVKLIAVNPVKDEIAIYETDGFSINRLSVWNWKTKKRKFAKRFSDAISTLAYSAKGTLLMAGTTSLNGMVFLDSNTGNQKKVVQEATGIVTMAVSSATESSLITYAPSGSITYIDMKTGGVKARFSTIPDLLQPVLHNNNLYLSGVKNDTVVTVNATTGKTIHEYPAPGARLLTKSGDTAVMYISQEPEGYTIYKAGENMGTFTMPGDVPEELTVFSAANGADGVYYGGSPSGAMFRITADTYSPASAALVTENRRIKILDVVNTGGHVFLLTKDGVFKADDGRENIVQISSMTGRNLAAAGTDLILWSKNDSAPIYLIPGDGVAEPRLLYSPQRQVQSLSVAGDKIVFIENMNVASICDMRTGKIVFSYKGTSFQDAVLLNDTDLIIAKTAASGSSSPVLRINSKTGETVMLPFTGDVAFSLKTLANDPGKFFGLLISVSGTTKNTEVYEYDVTANTYTPLITWADEDASAFIYPSQKYIYTNIGKANIMLIDRASHKQYRMARSNALPVKITGNEDSLMVLNTDGSISWYNLKNNAHTGDWFLTKDYEWYSM